MKDVHSVAEGYVYRQARLPPDSSKGSFGSLFELPDPFAVGSHYIDSKNYPTLGRQTDSLPKWSSSAWQCINSCTFLVKAVIVEALGAAAAALLLNFSGSWRLIIVEKASRIYLLPPPGTYIIGKERVRSFSKVQTSCFSPE